MTLSEEKGTHVAQYRWKKKAIPVNRDVGGPCACVPEDGCWLAGPGPVAGPLEVHGQGGAYVGAMGLKLAQTPHHPNRSRPWGPP